MITITPLNKNCCPLYFHGLIHQVFSQIKFESVRRMEYQLLRTTNYVVILKYSDFQVSHIPI